VVPLSKVKDIFNEEFINRLALSLSEGTDVFKKDDFYQQVYQNDWDELEFKQRVRRISTAMHESLESDFLETLPLLYKIAPEFSGLAGIIFPDYVEQYGIYHWDESLAALSYLTEFSTSEFAIRSFLLLDLERVHTQMIQWATHENEHIRRLASEGSRPRLPWGTTVPALKENPLLYIPVLEGLLLDDSLYVRKSVANHLNDLSKTHPTALIELIQKWQGKDQRSDWVLRHASRTLLKQGNKEILSLFGYTEQAPVQISNLTIESYSISIGDSLQFSFSIESEIEAKLRIEYAIDYVKKNGKTNRKIFKLSEITLRENQKKNYIRTQSFRNMTTRVHYEGVHTLSILVNGDPKISCDFQVNR